MNQKNTIRLCFFFWAILGSWTLAAQEKPFSELALGVRQGYQFSRINFDPGIAQSVNQGFTSGIILQYLSQPQLGFQMEINYSQRGWNVPEFGEPIGFRRDMDYLEIPFLTHFAIGKKSFRVILNLGSYVSFLLNNEATFYGGPYEIYFQDKFVKSFSYGLAGGTGFALRSKIGVFQAEVRGALGLTDVYSPTETSFESAPEQFFGYQFSYLYRFGGKKRKAAALEQTIEESQDLKDPETDENETGNL